MKVDTSWMVFTTADTRQSLFDRQKPCRPTASMSLVQFSSLLLVLRIVVSLLPRPEPLKSSFCFNILEWHTILQYPRQESNLDNLRLRTAACIHHTPGTFYSRPRGSRTHQPSFVDSALGKTARQPVQYSVLESNQSTGLRKPSARRTARQSMSSGYGCRTHRSKLQRPTCTPVPPQSSVAREGLEPSRLMAQPSESCVSADSTIWLFLHRRVRIGILTYEDAVPWMGFEPTIFTLRG